MHPDIATDDHVVFWSERKGISSDFKTNWVEFHPVKSWVATGDQGNHAYIFDFENGERIRHVTWEELFAADILSQDLRNALERQADYLGPSASSNHKKKRENPGSLLQVRFYDKDVVYWRAIVQTNQVLLPSDISRIGLATVFQTLLFLLYDYYIAIVDIDTLEHHLISYRDIGGQYFQSFDFVYGQPWIAIGGQDGGIRIFDFKENRMLYQFSGAHRGKIQRLVVVPRPVYSSNLKLSEFPPNHKVSEYPSPSAPGGVVLPLMISGAADGKLSFWDLHELFTSSSPASSSSSSTSSSLTPYAVITEFFMGSEILDVDFNPSNRSLIVSLKNRYVLVISMHRELISRERLPKDVQGVSSVTLCRGIGNWALAVSKDTLIQRFPAESTLTGELEVFVDLSWIPGAPRKFKMYSIRRHLLHSNVVCVGTNRGVLVLRLDAGSEPQVGFRSIPGFGNFSLLSKQDGCGTIKGDPGNVSERSQASASCSGQLLPSVSAWQIAQSGYIWRAQTVFVRHDALLSELIEVHGVPTLHQVAKKSLGDEDGDDVATDVLDGPTGGDNFSEAARLFSPPELFLYRRTMILIPVILGPSEKERTSLSALNSSSYTLNFHPACTPSSNIHGGELTESQEKAILREIDDPLTRTSLRSSARVSISSSGRFCSVLFPELRRFIVYEFRSSLQFSSNDKNQPLEYSATQLIEDCRLQRVCYSGDAISLEWCTYDDRLAVLMTNAVPSSTIEIFRFSSDGVESIHPGFVPSRLALGKRLFGGPLLGVSLVRMDDGKESQEDEITSDSGMLQFFSWQGSDVVGAPLPRPILLQWDAERLFVVMGYISEFLIFSCEGNSRQLEMVCRVPGFIKSAMWHMGTLFFVTDDAIRCLFPHPTNPVLVTLASSNVSGSSSSTSSSIGASNREETESTSSSVGSDRIRDVPLGSSPVPSRKLKYSADSTVDDEMSSCTANSLVIDDTKEISSRGLFEHSVASENSSNAVVLQRQTSGVSPRPPGILSIVGVLDSHVIVVNEQGTPSFVPISDPSLRFMLLAQAGAADIAMKWLPQIHPKSYSRLADFLVCRGYPRHAVRLPLVSTARKLEICLEHHLYHEVFDVLEAAREEVDSWQKKPQIISHRQLFGRIYSHIGHLIEVVLSSFPDNTSASSLAFVNAVSNVKDLDTAIIRAYSEAGSFSPQAYRHLISYYIRQNRVSELKILSRFLMTERLFNEAFLCGIACSDMEICRIAALDSEQYGYLGAELALAKKIRSSSESIPPEFDQIGLTEDEIARRWKDFLDLRYSDSVSVQPVVGPVQVSSDLQEVITREMDKLYKSGSLPTVMEPADMQSKLAVSLTSPLSSLNRASPVGSLTPSEGTFDVQNNPTIRSRVSNLSHTSRSRRSTTYSMPAGGLEKMLADAGIDVESGAISQLDTSVLSSISGTNAFSDDDLSSAKNGIVSTSTTDMLGVSAGANIAASPLSTSSSLSSLSKPPLSPFTRVGGKRISLPRPLPPQSSSPARPQPDDSDGTATEHDSDGDTEHDLASDSMGVDPLFSPVDPRKEDKVRDARLSLTRTTRGNSFSSGQSISASSGLSELHSPSNRTSPLGQTSGSKSNLSSANNRRRARSFGGRRIVPIELLENATISAHERGLNPSSALEIEPTNDAPENSPDQDS